MSSFCQVADQQGKYLGHLFATTDGNVTKQSVLELQKAAIRPFEYHHFGSFAYVGDNKAVLQMPVIGIDDVCVQDTLFSSATKLQFLLNVFRLPEVIKGVRLHLPTGWLAVHVDHTTC